MRYSYIFRWVQLISDIKNTLFYLAQIKQIISLLEPKQLRAIQYKCKDES